MYKSIYKTFSHWYNDDKGTIFLYSDPHFSDVKLYTTCRVGMSDEEQIRKINSKVGKYDTIIFLGDIGNPECINRIRGRKILIMGNHDSGASNYLRTIKVVKGFETLADAENSQCNGEIDFFTIQYHSPFIVGYKNVGYFDEVYEGALIISDKIILSHEPLLLSNFLNIHGHCHTKIVPDDVNHINVCAEHIDYTPISLNQIIKSGKLKQIKTLHRDTIDKASKR